MNSHWCARTELELRDFVSSQLRDGRHAIVFDFEADNSHRYQDQLCLVQFSDGECHGLIDPLSIKDLSPLFELFEEKQIWMHGADYDMSLMLQTFGKIPSQVLDTQTAARMLGFRHFGYAALVQHFFDLKLCKSSQREDWAKRPLPEQMLDYALNDVRYLLPIANQLEAMLVNLGRYEWFLETCEHDRIKVLNRPKPNQDEVWRIKGSGKLNSQGLSYLRALWYWRDQEAREWDRPPFMVVNNNEMLKWCDLLLTGKEIPMKKHWRDSRIERLRAVIRNVSDLSENEWPKKVSGTRIQKNSDFDHLVEKMLKRRDEVSKDLNIDGPLIISRMKAEQIASNQGVKEGRLMLWQEGLLGDALPSSYWDKIQR